MKKLLVVLLMLATASMANAQLWLSVNGVVDPPDTEVTLAVSEHAVIDIYGDGTGTPDRYYMALIDNGAGSLDIDDAVVLYGGSDAFIMWETDPDIIAAFHDMGLTDPILVGLGDVPPPGTDPLPLGPGKLIDLIDFHCELKDVDATIVMIDKDANPVDDQVIHQIPEPMTMVLLGLGGLLLRRRR
jgi:hypothetical protein